jgi:transcriptional regulator with XRE-family HTH domain
MDSIGAQIYKARCALSISQAQLATRIGVGQQAVSNWERERALPRKRTLVRLRAALGVPLVPPQDGPAAKKAAKYSRHPTATVYDEIRSRIELGVYVPGDVLPAQGTMASRWGVNIAAVQRAVRQLVDEGWLASRPGGSPVVCLRQPPPTPLLAGTILPVSNAHID